ncbi:DUF2247 family protein [Rhizobium nepotum]|jgi:hypothetical protein|uniref:DUF2247 family protein n=1 Tax=Rhizobium nepotum TaxID=1035271 RepID=UPI0009FDC4D8
MRVSLDGKFCLDTAPWLNWGDIKYGFDHKYLDSNSVVQFATASLSIDSSSYQYDLAMCDPKHESVVSEILNNLTNGMIIDTADAKRSWIFIFLKKLYICREEYKDPLGEVEKIYADFDYPEYISPLVRYMPASDGAITGEDEILRRWEGLLHTLQAEISRERDQ